MDRAQLQAFADELEKIAGLKDLWQRFTGLFQRDGQSVEAKRFVKSPDRAKWDGFLERVKNPNFVKSLRRAGADKKLVTHAKSMHALQNSKPVANVEGSTGKMYDVKRLPGGRLGCTCRDWRYKGSVNPNHKCKHIKAYEEGKNKVASFNDTTASFFDELAKIEAANQRQADKSWQGADGEPTGRPYSTLLTQDEEPSDYNPRRNDEDDIEVVTRTRS